MLNAVHASSGPEAQLRSRTAVRNALNEYLVTQNLRGVIITATSHNTYPICKELKALIAKAHRGVVVETQRQVADDPADKDDALDLEALEAHEATLAEYREQLADAERAFEGE